MLIPNSAIRITDATSTAHLDKVERGYENMDHFHVEFKKVGQALRSIDFIQGKGSTESAPPQPQNSHFHLSSHLQRRKRKNTTTKREKPRMRKQPRRFQKAAPFRLLPSNLQSPSRRTLRLSPAPLQASVQLQHRQHVQENFTPVLYFRSVSFPSKFGRQVAEAI